MDLLPPLTAPLTGKLARASLWRRDTPSAPPGKTDLGPRTGCAGAEPQPPCWEGRQDGWRSALSWMLTITTVFSQETLPQVGAGVPRTSYTLSAEDQKEAGSPSAKRRPCALCLTRDVIPISQRRKLSHYIVHPFGKITGCLICAWAWGHPRGQERKSPSPLTRQPGGGRTRLRIG